MASLTASLYCGSRWLTLFGVYPEPGVALSSLSVLAHLIPCITWWGDSGCNLLLALIVDKEGGSEKFLYLLFPGKVTVGSGIMHALWYQSWFRAYSQFIKALMRPKMVNINIVLSILGWSLVGLIFDDILKHVQPHLNHSKKSCL